MSVITISFCSHAGPLPASVELLTRIELVTSSLPRKCSTTELQQQVSFRTLSGRRGSNPRPPAWKASALSTELLPRSASFGGRRWIRTTEGVRQQIYSLPHLATLVSALEEPLQPLPDSKPSRKRLQR